MTGIPVSARPHEPSLERLERAEELFADGDVTSARRMLSECLDDPAIPVEHQVQALNDLGVIANAQGRPDEAERLLLGAVSRDAGYVPALENLAALCARDDPVQATYWARRAAEAHPGAGETMAGETAAGELAELAPRDEAGVPGSTAVPRAMSTRS